MKSFKNLLFILVTMFTLLRSLLSYAIPPPPQEPTIVEVRTAAPGVIAVIVQTGPHGSDYVNPIDKSTSSYKVDGQNPVAVYLYSVPYDELPYDWGDPQRDYWVTVRHRIYLDIGKAFENNHLYSISTPYGDTTLIYNDRTTLCEAIKVNQVGYHKDSRVRYAVLGVFLGDGGSREFETLPTYEVIRESDGAIVKSGTAVFIKADTAIIRYPATCGEFVYRLDLRGIPEGGPYYVSIPGFGRSWPFGVGTDYTRFIAYTYMRGMYHQRCGIALEQPFTEYTRAICHTHAEDIRYPLEGNDKIPIFDYDKPIFEIRGGYHDAGDYDRRPLHVDMPIFMLGYYEAFKNHFIDGQYNIPESGNGIPDIFDEAMWGALVWEYLQVTDPTDPDYGGVRSGTEMDGYTGYGWASAATEETVLGLIYGTWEVTIDVTSKSCGLFAQISRLLTEGGWLPEKAADLRTRAELAWQYLERKLDINAVTSHRYGFTYAALQMYLLTGEEKYHNIFKVAADHCFINPDTLAAKYPECWGGGNPYTHAGTSHFISYLLPQKYPIDETTAQGLKNIIFKAVDRGGYMKFFPENESYPSGCMQSIGWGAATCQGIYADIYVFAYLLTNDAEKKQQYFDIISQFADYAIGLNPLGMSFVTGLGFVQPVCPTHDDSYYTKNGLSDGVTSDHVGKPKGNVPGLLIFGTAWGYSSNPSSQRVATKLYPSWESLPYYKRWADGWSFFSCDEVGTDKTLWNALMYAFLYNASEDPNADNFTNPNPPDNWPPSPPIGLYFLLSPPHPNPFNETTTINFTVGGGGKVKLAIYDLVGREIKVLLNEYLSEGSYPKTWDGTDESGNKVASGIYFCRLSGERRESLSEKVIFLK
ncbi:MAG: glycoside hydrolase family 9 protein [candidate division WOR-3 bacterium]